MRVIYWLGLGLIAAAIVEMFAALWWWALLGMSESVGLAHMLTPLILAAAGSLLAMWADDMGTR